MFHQCPVCHRKYANALVLQQHIKTHTGEPTELSAEQISAAEIRDFPPFPPFPPGFAGAPGGPPPPGALRGLFPTLPGHMSNFPGGFGGEGDSESLSPDLAQDQEDNDSCNGDVKDQSR